MKKVALDRECPFCHKDCGQKAQYYPFSVVVEANCKKCNAPITNEFKYPDFFWKIRNWYSTKTDKNGHSYIKEFKVWGEKA